MLYDYIGRRSLLEFGSFFGVLYDYIGRRRLPEFGRFFICVLMHHTECHWIAYVFRGLHSFPILGFWICVSMRIAKKISGGFFWDSGPCVLKSVPYRFISRIARVIRLTSSDSVKA